MLKKCLAFAAALLLFFTYGCSDKTVGTDVTEPSGGSDMQATGNETKEDITDILGNLLYKASLVDEIFTVGLDTEKKKDDVDKDYRSCCIYVRVSEESEYKSVEDIKKAVLEIYTRDAADSLYFDYYFGSGYPLYKDYGGRLYYDVALSAEPKSVAHRLSKTEIIEKTSKFIKLTVPSADSYDSEADSNPLLDSCIVMENEDGKWKLARSGVEINTSFMLEYDMIAKKYAYSGDFCSLAPRSKYEDGNSAYVMDWGSVSKYGSGDTMPAKIASFDEKCLTENTEYVPGGSSLMLIVPKYTNSTINIYDISSGARGKTVVSTSGSVFLTIGKGKDSIKYEVEIISPDSEKTISFRPYSNDFFDWFSLPDRVGSLKGYWG